MNTRNLVSSNHENGFNRVSRWVNRARHLPQAAQHRPLDDFPTWHFSKIKSG
jgi:hypothetical protein